MNAPYNTPRANDSTMWAAGSHICALLGTAIFPCNFLIPALIVAFNRDSDFICRQAKESVNFQISVFIWALISAVCCLFVVGFFMLGILALLAIILPIVATIKAAGGTDYRYPLIFRIWK
jgi:uncharacterized Tic20 family protein